MVLEPFSPKSADEVEVQAGQLFLASMSPPDVKMTVRGLFGEKSCIQSIGMLLIDLTSRAPAAISATISPEVRPFNAALHLVTPAKLMSATGSTCAFVASIKTRPRQSIRLRASGTRGQWVARTTTSHSAACRFVSGERLSDGRPDFAEPDDGISHNILLVL